MQSLEILNRQFVEWAEDENNTSFRSAIGMKPIDRFGLDLKRIRFLSPSEANDELFFAEATRKVKKDNTFSFKNKCFETPVNLRDKQIQIRYERSRYSVVIVYYKSDRMGEARPLDAIANGLLRRKEMSK